MGVSLFYACARCSGSTVRSKQERAADRARGSNTSTPRSTPPLTTNTSFHTAISALSRLDRRCRDSYSGDMARRRTHSRRRKAVVLLLLYLVSSPDLRCVSRCCNVGTEPPLSSPDRGPDHGKTERPHDHARQQMLFNPVFLVHLVLMIGFSFLTALLLLDLHLKFVIFFAVGQFISVDQKCFQSCLLQRTEQF